MNLRRDVSVGASRSTGSMRRSFSDVIVVGGGPCGSFAALNLARLGMSVDVFEEHNETGVPSHCAGHLSLKGLRALGLYPLPSEIIEDIYQGATFHSPNGKSFAIRFSSPVTCSVNRVLFDKYVADAAEKVGAKYFFDSRIESLAVEKNLVKGVVVKHGRTQSQLSARLIVDAEGVSSRILRQAGLHGCDRRMLVKAVHAEVENVKDVDTGMVEVFFSNKYAPGFYAWLMPKRDGKAKIGLASKTGNPKELLRKLMIKHPTASERLCDAKILQSSFHSIPLGGPIPKTYSDGFLVVGDAASHVKPTTGGGVILGMTCAKIAAEVAHEASIHDDFSSEFLLKYQKRCDRILGSDFKTMLRMRRMFDALSDKKLDDAVEFCGKIGLDRALRKLEDIDFQGRSLLRVLWRPRISVALLYFLFLHQSANH